MKTTIQKRSFAVSNQTTKRTTKGWFFLCLRVDIYSRRFFCVNFVIKHFMFLPRRLRVSLLFLDLCKTYGHILACFLVEHTRWCDPTRPDTVRLPAAVLCGTSEG